MPNKERAASRGHTWDAWPCCESPVDESRLYHGRPKRETMCSNCRELIKVGKETLRKAAEAGEREFKWVTRHHEWPGYHGRYQFQRYTNARFEDPHDAGDNLRRKMFELVNALTHPKHEKGWTSKAPKVLECSDTSRRISAYQDTICVTMDADVQTALNAFDEAVREALKSSYQEGKQRGQSILLNLAGNEISVNDFNRKTAEDTDCASETPQSSSLNRNATSLSSLRTSDCGWR